MKHIALLTTLLLSASLQAVEKPYDYVFFENSLMKGDYFYSQAKYTSPYWKMMSHLLGLKMRDIIFQLPALSLLLPAIPWSLPMYPLPVEIGIARYNIARSVAMTSFVSPLRSLYKYN